MGIDLILYPVECETPLLSFSHTMLRCDGQRSLFDVIAELKTRPAPEDFSTYRDEGYGAIEFDPYGDALTYIRAGELVKAAAGIELYPRNAAAWAYLAALDPQTKIVLYWH